MVIIQFHSDDEERCLRMTVSGHAGQADVGRDIVCASASILAFTVAQIVCTMEHHGDLEEKPTIQMESGNANIVCRCKDNDIYAEAAHAFFVAKVGYSLLQHNYPQYVKLIPDVKDENP